MCVTMLGKRYMDCIQDLEGKKVFERLWMQSYRKDASRIYIKIEKSKVSILYKDFTKFRHEQIDYNSGHDGSIKISGYTDIISTKIGNFSKCIINYSTNAKKTILVDTRYNTKLGAYGSYCEAVWNIGKAASKLDTIGMNSSIKYVIWEILLNIVQHNFTEGIDFEPYSIHNRE